ncbi:transferrin-binding protein-like solute binding protein [Psychrobacter celer]|uniref:transferrin-binding protein-like solute binding protein n=1 Tax=Psychrobacter celer TaxID=306572 RepID=UPI003FD106D5
MSLNRHSISAVATAKKLKTPLKASVVILTTVILASCASDGGDSTTPKPSPTIPKDDSGTVGGSETEGSGVDTGSNAQAEAAIKAAEAKTKAAEAALKQAKAKTKAAEDALKAAEMKFGAESQKAAEASQKAIDAARSEAAKAKAAAEAARVEAVAKIEAAAQEAEGKIKAAKEAAAKEAVAKVKVAEANAKAAEARANTAEAKAKELQDLLASETAAKEAAEAEKKTAEAETKKAQDKVKTAEEKAAAAIKAVAAAKAEADKKIAALKEATASQVAVAEKEATAAKEALKTAEAQAIVAAKAAAKAAADAAAAAAKEAAAKLEAVKSASAKEITAAKKAAADAQARADKAVKDAADAQKRVEEAEAIAKSEADRADLEASRKEQAIKQAEEAKAEALKAKDEAIKANKEAADSKQLAEKAKADLETAEAALAKAEKDLAEALASGGNPEALQAEVDRRQAALDAANAKATAAEQAQAAATAAAEAQIAAANQATQAANDALTAAQIKNAPETEKSGVQHVSIDASGVGQGILTTTTRNFGITDETQVQARADIASRGLVSDPVALQVSGDNDTAVAGSSGFNSFENTTKVVTATLGEQDLVYTSTYKDFSDDLRVAHIDGAAAGLLPVNGVAVVGNATQAENMPTEGKVGYTGDATYRKLGIGNDIEFGKSVFTADFVAKNVKGDLTFDNAGKIGLTADINGNQFSGTAADNAGYNTEGGFFGGDAQYLGGVYQGNGAQGTYGAKSDQQTAAEQAAVKAQAEAAKANADKDSANAQAAAAKAAADKAQADAVKAQEALAKAEEALANAGTGDGGLAAALARAEAAEKAEAAALAAAATAETARLAAEQAQAAAEDAALKAKAAADKAVGDAKAEADKKVAEANQQAADAKAQAAKAEADAAAAKAAEDTAKAEALKAKADAETAIAAANAKADTANQQAIDAKAQAELEKQKAATAQAEADKAKDELLTAQDKLAAAEKALEDALASGGSTEALQAEVDRRQAALDAANAEVSATQQAQADAQAAAEAQIAAAQQAAQDAKDALAASQIKNAPEVAKSGVQSLNINVTPLSKVYNTTTRDFEATDNSIVARADIASESEPGKGDGLLGKVGVTTSGNADTALANGFMSHADSAEVSVPALGQTLPLTYVSTYKDFEDDMRIGHIDGKAVFSGAELPVNGVAVVGNATQAENMPTEGSVGYTGDATYRQLGIDNDIEFGKSVFTADFVAKNLKGNLAFDKAGKIGLTAAIDGNQFSGTAADNAGYNTEGGFFGGDAQYLGGVYEGNGAQGTYGAKSDLQTAAEQAAIKAQADADAANAAIAGVQAQADAAKAAADKAQADAAKAQEALAKAEENLANAGNGEDQLAAALERAAAAEAAEAAALDAATKATAAKDAALAAQAAAEDAAIKAQQAADKAIGEAKLEADKKVAEANQQAADAKAQAADAQTRADAAEAAEAKAKAEAITAKEQAETAIAAANAKADQANQQASAAQALAQAEKQKAETAQAEADQAKSELVTAQQKLAEAEQALADALASGGGNTEALQAEVDRRQAALDAANAEVIATQQAQADAQAAAEAQIAAAQQAAQDAKDALAASQIKNAPEVAKSGVQSLNINVTPLSKVYNTTTRDFEATDNSIVARADIASESEPGKGDGLLGKVGVTTSGNADTALANGFMSHADSAEVSVPALGQTLPLTYVSTYKDFEDDMRIGHIDGKAVFSGAELPVNGVAVVGNATQAENMPTEGSVGYTGDATYRQLGIDNDIEFGKSVFTADFVAKNLKGNLAFDKAGKIGLTAAIDGNQFSGTAADNAGYNTEGGFFGGDAQYLGGVYEGNGAQGTYGAKSDLQTAAEQAAIKAQADADAANAAIAGVQAQADAAKAAADKAQADAAKAQEALAKAEENLANAGNGEDQLAAALERAAAAEAAEAAALDAAATAEAARLAAENAKAAAEEAVIQAEAAAQAAIGDAKAEAAQKVAEAKQQAADAEQAQLEANARADAAETARLEAEARAKAAEDALEAAQQLPPAPTNPKAPVNVTITGFQNSIADHDNSGISANTSASYDTYTALLNETGSKDFKNSINVELRNASDEDYEGSFKKSELKQIGGIFNNKLNYTSTYKNFDEQMQVGHVYGDLKGLANLIRLSKLSNVYVQGNSTNIDDMQYMKELSQYNIDNGINDGKVDYNGVASYIGNSKSEIIGKDPIIGTSEFKVDFVDSQVDGTLSFDGSSVSQKKIKAEITGNTFAGNWNGVDTKGGFFGEDAKLLGGVYQVSGGKGTYGATKVDPSAEPVPEPKAITGVMSNTISSVSGLGTDDAIGYRQFVTDNQTFTTTTGEGEETTPNIVEDSAVDNLPSYDKFAARLDIVKPNKFKQPAMITTVRNNDVAFDADSGFMKSKDKNSVTFKNVGSVIGDIDLKYNYDSVYRNFDTQMQIGHVYGDLVKESGIGSGVKSRYTNVYVMGQATENMPTDGNVQYAGVATYMDNLHLGSGAIKDPVVNGTSTFNVDFVNDSMTGELTFAGINKNIGISANITGNTFAGSKDNIATSGGFYGDGAKFLGGIYQEAQPGNVAGTGTTPGTGTTFQGTFGAEKQ